MPKRNRYKPTPDERNRARAMAGFGFKVEEIALAIGRGVPTVKKHFRLEMKDGPTVANAKVIETLYKIATATDEKGKPIGSTAQVAAAQLWVKVRAGWSTVENLKVSGIPGSSEPADLRNLSADDLRTLERIAKLAEIQGGEPGSNRLADESNGLPSAN